MSCVTRDCFREELDKDERKEATAGKALKLEHGPLRRREPHSSCGGFIWNGCNEDKYFLFSQFVLWGNKNWPPSIMIRQMVNC